MPHAKRVAVLIALPFRLPPTERTEKHGRLVGFHHPAVVHVENLFCAGDIFFFSFDLGAEIKQSKRGTGHTALLYKRLGFVLYKSFRREENSAVVNVFRHLFRRRVIFFRFFGHSVLQKLRRFDYGNDKTANGCVIFRRFRPLHERFYRAAFGQMMFQNAVQRVHGVIEIQLFAEELIRVEKNSYAEELLLNSVRIENIIRGIAFPRFVKNRFSVFCLAFVAFGYRFERVFYLFD